MNLSKTMIGACILVAVVTLPGCANFKSARAYGECQSPIGGGVGGSCKLGAEAVWESKKSFMNTLLSKTGLAPDAGSYSLDVSGSTIPFPTGGNMVVTLKDSETGSTIAAQTFAWTRVGTVITASNPDSINSWAYAYAGLADTVSYELASFRSAYGPGLQTIAANSYYESTHGAGFSKTFFGGSDCPRHPVTNLCRD